MTEGLPLLEDVWVQHPIEVKVDGFLSHDRILRLGLAKGTHQSLLHFSAFGKLLELNATTGVKPAKKPLQSPFTLS